jgi:4-hydroxy-tetrahydrodipicolinate synthase
MFAEVNPQPIKKALQLAGIIPTDRMRLPMVSVEPETAAKVEAAMKAAGLL